MRWYYYQHLVCILVVVLASFSFCRDCCTLLVGANDTTDTGNDAAIDDNNDDDNDDDDDDDDDTNYYTDVEDAYEEQQELYNNIVMEEGSTKLEDIWDILHCDTLTNAAPNGHLPIHDASVWTFLRGAYIGTVGYMNSTIRYETLWRNGYDDAAAAAATNTRKDPEKHESEQQASSSSSSSLSPPILVQYHPQKGRAVYANQIFQKGAVVRTKDYTACFQTGTLYRQFLVAIPPYLACDVLEWAYSGTQYGVCVALDEGSFINHASTPVYDPTTGERIMKRTRYYEADLPNDRPNLANDIAVREIHIGEELLADYEEFAEVDAWSEFGLGGWKAPDDTEDDEDDEDDDEDDEDDDGVYVA